jgi:polyhydroxyalkanoate synthesis regulator phasin
MPEPRSTTVTKKAPGKARQAAAAVDPTGLLETLAKGVVLTADRIQEVLDDAVRRGRMTRDDAEELARVLIETGRRQTEELVRTLRRESDRARRAAEKRLG